MQRTDVDLGSRLVPYSEGRALQQEVHDAVVSGSRPSTILVLEHEPVYTVGRRARSWERPPGEHVEPGHVPVIEADRGGRTTWHGPGQLVIYPIVRLSAPIDVIRYVRALEGAVMQVCEKYSVPVTRVDGRSGVWVPADPASPQSRRRTERKVCALGVRVARDVTMHGIGLNVCNDLAVFGLERIIPCGIRDAGVTSLSAETGRTVPVTEPVDLLVSSLEQHLAPLVAQTT